MSIAVADKLRWSLAETCKMVSQSENYIRALERKREFPPRIACPPMVGSGPGGKSQFIADEVRAWAQDCNWQTMVAHRLGADWRNNRHAS